MLDTHAPAPLGGAGVVIGILLAVQPAGAQSPTGAAIPTAATPSFVAVASADPPRLDGVVLGDPVWNAAAPATGFRQTQPDEGAPASERTEVRVVFTASTLYIGGDLP